MEGINRSEASQMENFGPIVSVSWLAQNIDNQKLVLLDASLKSGPMTGGEAIPHMSVRLPGARHFDFEERICDRASPLPHMMPTPHVFEEEVRSLGVNRDSMIVVYDRVGLYTSPRAWWMFKAMGHDQVAVLDGGLPAWIEAGRPVEPVSVGLSPMGDFVAHPRPGLICDKELVKVALDNDGYALLDARSEGRFSGRDPEPRPGLRPGHMPRALNLPYTEVQNLGHMLPAGDLEAMFASRVKPGQRLIFTCGSGVTACTLALAAELAGYAGTTVYDGSWSEWGLPSDLPVVTTNRS